MVAICMDNVTLGNPDCNTAFPLRETLESTVINYLAIVDGSLENTHPEQRDRQLIFPNMTFTCSATISRLIVGANVSIEGFSSVPEVQIWRRTDTNSDTNYTRVDSIPLSLNPMPGTSGSLNVHQLEISLSFVSGDVLGIFYPHQSNILLPTLAGRGSVVHSRDFGISPPYPDSFQQGNDTPNTTRQWPLLAFSEGKIFCLNCRSQMYTMCLTV